MAIPKFTKDVEVIQKLSDLPNTTDGLTAEQLKAKFDEAALLVKTFLNSELIPAIQAKNIPFDKTGEIDAADIQNAIVEVQKQVREAASGTIVNGSVTKEKLAAELLARVYGGRPWVSMKTPDSKDNVAEDFPIGQVWFRPAFDVVNVRSTNWTGNGCTVAAEAQKVTLTGNKTVTATKMTQSLTGIGQAGDIVHILFDVTERDSEITNMAMAVNGGEAETINGSVAVEAELMINGSLMLEIGAAWPSTSLAGGNLVIENLAIVNVSQLHRQLTEGQAIPDWAAYLRNLLPLESYHSSAEVYLQVTDGNWWPMGFEVLPVSRGGTGVTGFEKDHFLIGGANRELRQAGVAEVISLLGSLRMATGSYTGNAASRTLDIGIEPKLLYIYPTTGPTHYGDESYTRYATVDNPVVLANGATAGETNSHRVSDGSSVYMSTVKLFGSSLIFDAKRIAYISQPRALLANRSGVTYNWVALY
jgi:hypothetical protein